MDGASTCPLLVAGSTGGRDRGIALTEHTVQQSGELPACATDTSLLQEIRRHSVPDELLAKLTDKLHSNRSQIHVLTARVLRLESVQKEHQVSSSTAAMQQEKKKIDKKETARRFKVWRLYLVLWMYRQISQPALSPDPKLPAMFLPGAGIHMVTA